MSDSFIKPLKSVVTRVFKSLGCEIIKTSTKKTELTDYKRLMNEYKHFKVLKLHFGCGPRVLKGWINIDLVYVPYEDYLKNYTDVYYSEQMRGDKKDFFAIDITKVGLPLPNNSVDVIFHEDFIEHLNQKDQIIFLAESYRVLKKGGVHRVNTPNLSCSMKKYSNFSMGIKGIYLEIWDKHYHLNVLTPSMLEEMALMVGYSKVMFNSRNSSISNLIPPEFRPAPPNEGENFFADLMK